MAWWCLEPKQVALFQVGAWKRRTLLSKTRRTFKYHSSISPNKGFSSENGLAHIPHSITGFGSQNSRRVCSQYTYLSYLSTALSAGCFAWKRTARQFRKRQNCAQSLAEFNSERTQVKEKRVMLILSVGCGLQNLVRECWFLPRCQLTA